MPAPAILDPATKQKLSRRRFLGFVVAAPTLVVAADLTAGAITGATAAAAPLPTLPQPAEVYDLLDALRDAMRPTANLITIEVNRDGTVSFALPRSDNGQGIVTSTQMIIAEEMDLEVDQVVVTLADARPELLFNQLTGGSSTTFTTYTAIRVAAALARKRLLDAAAAILEQDVDTLTSRAGVIEGFAGTLGYGELTERAASAVTEQVEVVLKDPSEFRILGKPYGLTDARDIVTGRKKFATDLQIENALPTMICRAPELNGTPRSVGNLDEVRGLPGVTDVVEVGTGIAVRAETFGQCIEAVRALDVEWRRGTVSGENDESVLDRVRAAELPMAVNDALVGDAIDASFTFYFKSTSPLETNSAIADVRPGRAEIWAALKNPIAAQAEIAKKVGLPQTAVTVNVMRGGGSFGRKLHFDAALEAAEVSKAMGKPVKLMWHRADDSRVGRVHPLCTSRIRAVVTGDSVLSFEQRHTSVATEGNPGLGEAITANAVKAPGGNLTLSQSLYVLTQITPYNFGVSTTLLNEVDMRFNTSSMRNIYSPDTATARELMVDQIAGRMRRDPLDLRLEFVKTERSRNVLRMVAEEGDWGRTMEQGTAQGLGFHQEYKGVAACLVEIDARPETVDRKIREGVTGPRVTKVVYAVDIGQVLNPRTVEAQMMGGINDALALILTSSLHLEDGHFVEASWDNYFYTRQWNTPPSMKIMIVEDSAAPEPGGVGEFGVAATCGAIANAYARATGRVPEYFPINHRAPFPFEPKPVVPPMPPAPTDGLRFTF